MGQARIQSEQIDLFNQHLDTLAQLGYQIPNRGDINDIVGSDMGLNYIKRTNDYFALMHGEATDDNSYRSDMKRFLHEAHTARLNADSTNQDPTRKVAQIHMNALDTEREASKAYHRYEVDTKHQIQSGLHKLEAFDQQLKTNLKEYHRNAILNMTTRISGLYTNHLDDYDGTDETYQRLIAHGAGLRRERDKRAKALSVRIHGLNDNPLDFFKNLGLHIAYNINNQQRNEPIHSVGTVYDIKAEKGADNSVTYRFDGPAWVFHLLANKKEREEFFRLVYEDIVDQHFRQPVFTPNEKEKLKFRLKVAEDFLAAQLKLHQEAQALSGKKSTLPVVELADSFMKDIDEAIKESAEAGKSGLISRVFFGGNPSDHPPLDELRAAKHRIERMQADISKLAGRTETYEQSKIEDSQEKKKIDLQHRHEEYVQSIEKLDLDNQDKPHKKEKLYKPIEGDSNAVWYANLMLAIQKQIALGNNAEALNKFKKEAFEKYQALEKTINEKEAGSATDKSTLKELKDKLSKLLPSIFEAEEELKKADIQLALKVAEVQQSQQALNDAKSKVSRLDNSITAAQNEQSTLQSTIQSKKQAISALNETYQDSIQEVSRLQTEYDRLLADQSSVPSKESSETSSLNDEEERTAISSPERPSYTRIEIDGDGDCGYTAYGTTRREAIEKLTAHLDTVSDRVQIAVNEALLEEGFRQYLRNNRLPQFAEGDLDNDATLREQNAGNRKVQRAYIDYDLQQLRIGNGYAHPAILQALAQLDNVELHIWRLQDERLVPHVTPLQEDYSIFNAGVGRRQVHLLFVNNNHFDRIEFQPPVQEEVPTAPEEPEGLRTARQALEHAEANSQRAQQELDRAKTELEINAENLSTLDQNIKAFSEQLNRATALCETAQQTYEKLTKEQEPLAGESELSSYFLMSLREELQTTRERLLEVDPEKQAERLVWLEWLAATGIDKMLERPDDFLAAIPAELHTEYGSQLGFDTLITHYEQKAKAVKQSFDELKAEKSAFDNRLFDLRQELVSGNITKEKYHEEVEQFYNKFAKYKQRVDEIDETTKALTGFSQQIATRVAALDVDSEERKKLISHSLSFRQNLYDVSGEPKLVYDGEAFGSARTGTIMSYKNACNGLFPAAYEAEQLKLHIREITNKGMLPSRVAYRRESLIRPFTENDGASDAVSDANKLLNELQGSGRVSLQKSFVITPAPREGLELCLTRIQHTLEACELKREELKNELNALNQRRIALERQYRDSTRDDSFAPQALVIQECARDLSRDWNLVITAATQAREMYGRLLPGKETNPEILNVYAKYEVALSRLYDGNRLKVLVLDDAKTPDFAHAAAMSNDDAVNDQVVQNPDTDTLRFS